MTAYRTDALVVLGRGVEADGTLPRLAQQRVERAAELFAWETAPRIIFSGRCSLMTDCLPAMLEASAMASYAASLGLPRSALLVESSRPTSTFSEPPGCFRRSSVIQRRIAEMGRAHRIDDGVPRGHRLRQARVSEL